MNNANATTIIRLLAAIELASEDAIDPDAAIELLELAASQLHSGNSDERFCLSEAVDSILDSDEDLSPEEVEFYEHFMENFGLK
ncbi:MAG TPA: hypothetical protein VIC08_07745 [Cellvibrionaceae bacterium]